MSTWRARQVPASGLRCTAAAADGVQQGRRAVVRGVGLSLLLPLSALAAGDSIVERLTDREVGQLNADLSSNEDIAYPDWMLGNWQVTAQLTAFSVPQGSKFLGGRSQEINEKSSAEAAEQIGKEVSYQLRFARLSPGGAVREARLFNTQQRIDGYAGRPVVRGVEYVPLDRGGKTKDLNTLTYFKGGLVGKTFSTRRRWEAAGEKVFRMDETTRQLYGRRCNQAVESKVCPPPITTDQETLAEYTLDKAGGINAKVRLLGFLNPNDRLYFSARQKAVTVSDYSLQMTLIPEAAP